MVQALITGVNSQDGSYLADFLLKKDYYVIGTVRSKNPKWPDGFNPNRSELEIVQCDLGFSNSISNLFSELGNIEELYNLAAQSHVGYSFEHPEETYRITGIGASMLMDAYFKNYPNGHFYQASSSEMYGNQNSISVSGYDKFDWFNPVSPYGVAKTMAHFAANMHREMGHFVCDGILFNHESERRHESFVTQKICKKAVEIANWLESGKKGDMAELLLGNLYAERDWGYAPEYVEVMWKMMQEKTPRIYVIGTGVAHSVQWFVERVFEYLELDWTKYVDSGYECFSRPKDINRLCANPRDLNNLLGRTPTQAEELVRIMVNHQLEIQKC